MITNASESLRFAELCVHDELVFGENEKIGIGIYNEKRLHRVLKKTLCNNRGTVLLTLSTCSKA